MDDNILLQMRNICKTFPGVVALDDMNLTVKKGTVHALMGENGAGKSTLMKILIGLYHYDKGEIIFDGKILDTRSINRVLNQGISMIYQELNPLENMTVAENIYCGKEKTMLGRLVINKRQMISDTKKLLEDLQIDLKPDQNVERLSVAQKQLLEIAKATSYNSKLIIMDEPTSAITEKECQILFSIIRKLSEKGVSFIYITHKMDEVFEIADEITVMRDGRFVETKPAQETDHADLVKMMVGREIKSVYPKETVPLGDVALEVSDLSVDKTLDKIAFSVRAGEILGVAGLMGAGRTEIMEAVFGLRKIASGDIKIKGKKVDINNSNKAIKEKIAFITEDRKKSGCFLNNTVYYNTMLLSWNNKGFLINDRNGHKSCDEQIRKYRIKTPNQNQIMNNLSGGNQQKVLLSRWLLTDPDIIIMDEPTRGIDVGSKHEIYQEMTKLTKQGKAIIMISSELPEILGMSDRILVIHDGKVSGILDRENADQELILSYAAGLVDSVKKEGNSDESRKR